MIKQLTAEVYLAGDSLVVLGRPSELPIPEEHHNCDAMGCGSVGLHVLVRVPVAACCTDPGPVPGEPEEGADEEAEDLADQLCDALRAANLTPRLRGVPIDISSGSAGLRAAAAAELVTRLATPPPERALSEQLREAHDRLRAIAVAREQTEDEPAKGSRRLERLRWCYTTLGVIVGLLMREEEADGG